MEQEHSAANPQQANTETSQNVYENMSRREALYADLAQLALTGTEGAGYKASDEESGLLTTLNALTRDDQPITPSMLRGPHAEQAKPQNVVERFHARQAAKLGEKAAAAATYAYRATKIYGPSEASPR